MNTCSEMMTENPVSCTPSTTAREIAALMEQKDVGSIPIVESRENNKLLGIVTDRDLAIKVIAEGKDPDATTVEEVMTINPMTCSPKDKVDKVFDVMMKHQVRRVPVINEQNRLVGIISQADVAMRMGKSDKTGEVVEKLSQPASSRH
jgi:CBS domain-containing protein